MKSVMSAIREAIRNLAAFFVLSTILVRLVPGESYTRYLRFFLGLILLISLLCPIASALSAESLFTDAVDLIEEAFAEDPGGGEASLEDSIAAASEGEWAAILSVYQEEIQAQINEQIADLGVCVTDISADAGEGILTFVLGKEEKNAEDEITAADGKTAPGNGKIEIPVISVFVNAGEESGGGKAEEESGSGKAEEDKAGSVAESGSAGEAGTEEDVGTGETVLTDAELTVLARAAIAEYCGIDEEFVEVLLRE